MNSENTKKSFSNKLFDKLDSLFFLDKIIDFLMIFVGLYAALWFDNYIRDLYLRNQYIELLTRIHTEIYTNIDLTNSYQNSSVEIVGMSDDLLKLVSKGATESYEGTLKLRNSEVSSFETKSFNSYANESYLNKALQADILHVYDLYAKTESNLEVPRTAASHMYDAYFSLYVKTLYKVEDKLKEIIDFNLYFHKTTKHSATAQSGIKDIKITSYRVLEAIENELIRYGTSIDKSRNYPDYYWLSWSALKTDPKKSLMFAIEGISIIDSLDIEKNRNKADIQSYYGRLNRNAYEATTRLIALGDTTYNNNNLLIYLRNWEKSGVYQELCYVYYVDYYYNKKDFDEFVKYTNIILSKFYPYDIYIDRVSSWKQYMKTNTVKEMLRRTDIPMATWNNKINPRIFGD